MGRRPSGKFVLRISSDIHAGLQALAQCQGISLNQICVNIITQRMKEEQGLTRIGFDPGIPSQLFELLIKEFPKSLLGIILFGSVARGESTQISDIDLLLVLSSEIQIRRNLYHLWDKMVGQLPPSSVLDMNRFSPQFVSLPLEPKKAGSLWFETALEGRILWENDGVVSKCLQTLRGFMAEGSITRKVSHGHPYWVWNQERVA